MDANISFPQNPIEQGLEPVDSAWPNAAFENPEQGRASKPAAAGISEIAVPIAIGLGVLGLAVFGVTRLLRRGSGPASLLGDALRTASVSIISVMANRIGRQLVEGSLLGPRVDE